MVNIIEAFQCLLSPACILLMLFGLTMGIVLGAIPGLGGGIGITLMLPLTFTMESTTAIAFLMSISIGGISGGYIGSVLLGIPGDTTSLSTVLDGYPMTKKGETVRALSVCTVCNYIATVPSILLAMAASPLIASVAVKLGPWEFFGLCIFALSLIIALSKQNIYKGMIAMGLGFIFSSIGTDPLTGIRRFTFGTYELSGGLNIVSVMLGLFAGCSILMEFAKGNSATLSERVQVSGFRWPREDLKRNKLNIARSWSIGAVIGFLPGMGATLANVVAYAQAKNSSKTPEEFGKGCVDGVIAPETANNASIGGAMIPLLSLGIPGDGNTARILASLTIQGVQAGPL
ncbi:MAG: tripartite tricarboxylate transporter permease, partial [Lachnospiraceae bacterium]|nr:tripartite tricarboxylate transporter permease [Lachnospiraceae bacterium]